MKARHFAPGLADQRATDISVVDWGRRGIPLPVDKWHGIPLPTARHSAPEARHSAPGGTAFRSRRHGIPLPLNFRKSVKKTMKTTTYFKSEKSLIFF
jgi:hypothetical protein